MTQDELRTTHPLDDLPARCQQCGQPIDPRFSFCGDRCRGIKFLEPQSMTENLLVQVADEMHLLHRQYCPQNGSHMANCSAVMLSRQVAALLYPHRV